MFVFKKSKKGFLKCFIAFMITAVCTMFVFSADRGNAPENTVVFANFPVSCNKQPTGQIMKDIPDAEEISLSTKEETKEVSGLENCSYIDCTAYSYILDGKTASGIYTKRGVIAVDPKVIPLGTKVYVESLDSKEDYGYAIAADTGGAIRGNKIDMWVPTYDEAMENGVRKMRVYILSE